MTEQHTMDVITIDGKEYASVGKAQAILLEMSTEKGFARRYSRFAVYRLAVDHGVEILRTTPANYYSIAGLLSLKDKIKPEKGKKSGRAHYTAEKKEEAVRRYAEGDNCHEVAKKMGINYQSVNNWVTAAGIKRPGRSA